MPAKNFYEMLCKDKVFKMDYLKHRDCFRYIEKVSWKIINPIINVITAREIITLIDDLSEIALRN